ncbi:hypothetical protein LINPERPRIM_LOCUS37721 [Linum perenne]
MFSFAYRLDTVNKNLVGGSFMSTEQKKKLLWGNKKSTTTTAVEPSGHRWDTSLFGDRERQEKFNKLMSLSPQWYLWPIVGCEGRREGGNEDQQQQARRRWSSLGGKTGTAPDGVREAVHGRASKERWAHSWFGAVSRLCFRLSAEEALLCMLVYCYGKTVVTLNLVCLFVERMGLQLHLTFWTLTKVLTTLLVFESELSKADLGIGLEVRVRPVQQPYLKHV